MRFGRHKSNLLLLWRRPVLFAQLYHGALAFMLVGALLDAVTTYEMVAEHGAGVELHLALAAVIWLLGPAVGVVLGMIVKIGAVVFVAAIFRGWTNILLGLCGLLYFAAAVSNHFRLL